MAITNNPAAAAFRQAVIDARGSSSPARSEISPTEMKNALSELAKADSLTPAEKAQLAQEVFDSGASFSSQSASDALTNFIGAQQSPAADSVSPVMSRIAAMVGDSADLLDGVSDELRALTNLGKGAGVDVADLADVKESLQDAIGPMENVSTLLQQLSKGSDTSIDPQTAAQVQTDLNGVYGEVRDAFNALDKLISSGGGNAQSVGAAADEVAEAADAASAMAKGLGSAGSDLNILQPNATVSSRVSDSDLKFLEKTLGAYHDVSAVSDADVKQTRQLLSDLFDLPRGNYLTLEKAGGDSALFGSSVRGFLHDEWGNKRNAFDGDLNTGKFNLADLPRPDVIMR